MTANSPIEDLIGEYQSHLIHVVGLKPSTIQSWTFFVRLFLRAQFKPKAGPLDVQKITPQVLLGYVFQQSSQHSPGRLQSLASALRSLGRFLCVTGHLPTDLGPALPPIAEPPRPYLPEYLTAGQVEKLLQAFDRRTQVGRRDPASVLGVARLGLRAGEVAQLTLEDLDWRQGVLRLAQPKGRRERRLPVPAEVGRAMATSVRNVRPTGVCRALFLSLRDRGPLRSDAVSARVVAALRRAGLHRPHPGAHLLRHTLASHLVQQGASLKAVADLLGHAHLSTTQIYAKVNLPMLRAVALPWPKEVPR